MKRTLEAYRTEAEVSQTKQAGKTAGKTADEKYEEYKIRYTEALEPMSHTALRLDDVQTAVAADTR